MQTRACGFIYTHTLTLGHTDVRLNWSLIAAIHKHRSVVSYWQRINARLHTHTHTHTLTPWTVLNFHPPALEVSHHVSAFRNLGGSVEAHVGVLTIDHVLLERWDKTTDENEWIMDVAPHLSCQSRKVSAVPAWRTVSKDVSYNQSDK